MGLVSSAGLHPSFFPSWSDSCCTFENNLFLLETATGPLYAPLMISLFKWGIARPSLPLRWSRCFATFAEKVDEGWQTVIGLEIHAQIKTGKKLFSSKIEVS